MTERALPVTILEPAGIDPDLLDHTLSLRFDLGQFDPRITFTRNSSATYFGSDGLLKTAAANEPRIDYDPVTKVCKGFLVEESRTNLLTYSEQFDNAAWAKSKATVTQNAATAPDGNNTADLLFETATSGEHYANNTFSVVSGGTYCFSVYVKSTGAARNLVLRTALQGDASVYFNPLDGVSGVINSTNLNSSGSENVGNGWYRCWIAYTATGTGSALFRFHLAIGPSVSYAGDGTSGVYIWGAQLEVGAFPASYIKTEAASVTRAADSAVMTGANFSSWYRQDEGTISIDHAVAFDSNTSIFPLLFSVDNGTTSNRMSVIRRTIDDKVSASVLSGGVAQTGISSFGAALYGASQSVAFAYKTNDLALSMNATTPALDNEAAIPVVSRAVIGRSTLYFESLNGHIGRISYYPKRLTNTKLQALTA